MNSISTRQNSLIPLRFNHPLEKFSLILSSSSNRRPGVRHSTFESLRLGRNSVIHGFTSVGRANHCMPFLKAGYIIKVDRFEVARCSSMYKITDHLFLIRFISLTIIDEFITGAPEINLQCGWANPYCPGF
ncbi:hypothetical protein F2Q69_00005754 [Brassica cretica]|uniref:Uncharacterized protein n=1 Tax=Brassica cretica TaxID=69181 RepID=A0A8S9PBT1_BRACR|nr:hypothetical protein F2Q69_00005754 [Brassica cretica]